MKREMTTTRMLGIEIWSVISVKITRSVRDPMRSVRDPMRSVRDPVRSVRLSMRSVRLSMRARRLRIFFGALQSPKFSYHLGCGYRIYGRGQDFFLPEDLKNTLKQEATSSEKSWKDC